MNSKTNAITYAFRRPKFPVICDFDGDLFAARSPAVLERHLAGREISDISVVRKVRFVDASGEGWMLFQDKMILAPEFPMRTWRKIEIIRMFNESRKAREMGLCYPERRLANRRLDRIVCEIAGILSTGARIRGRQ